MGLQTRSSTGRAANTGGAVWSGKEDERLDNVCAMPRITGIVYFGESLVRCLDVDALSSSELRRLTILVDTNALEQTVNYIAI